MPQPKKSIYLRLDPDLLAWYRQQGHACPCRGYLPPRIVVLLLQSHTKYESDTLMSMRTSKVLSITMPPAMAKQAERLAQKENRSMSELMREAFRRYQQPAAAPATTMDLREYVRMIAPPDAALRAIREEARRKGTAKLTMREIDREIRAARRDRTRKTTNKPTK